MTDSKPMFAIALLVIALNCGCNGNQQAMEDSPAEESFHTKDQVLVEAVENGDLLTINKRLSAGGDVNAVGLRGVTILMIAIQNGQKDAAKLLLKAGANPNSRGQNGYTATTLAVLASCPKHSSSNIVDEIPDLELLSAVLSAGGDPNERFPNGDCLLTHISQQHNLPAIRAVFAAGGNIDQETRTGSPLIIATALGEYWDATWTLIELGANWRTVDRGFSVPNLLDDSGIVTDSPLYPFRERLRKFLIDEGIVFPTPSPQQFSFKSGQLTADGSEVR